MRKIEAISNDAKDMLHMCNVDIHFLYSVYNSGSYILNHCKFAAYIHSE